MGVGGGANSVRCEYAGPWWGTDQEEKVQAGGTELNQDSIKNTIYIWRLVLASSDLKSRGTFESNRERGWTAEPAGQ